MKIGIAGSMHFSEQMVEICRALKNLGHEPFVSSYVGAFIGKTDEERDAIKLKQKSEHDVIREFWEPMQTAEALLVANFDRKGIKGYIGGNAFLEMGFAHILNQKIFLLNPIPKIDFYESEIRHMRPIIINGDLSKIN